MKILEPYKKIIITALITLVISGGTFTTILTYASIPNEITEVKKDVLNNSEDINLLKECLPKKVNVKTYKAKNLEVKKELANKVDYKYFDLEVKHIHERFDDSDKKLDIALKLLNNNRLSRDESKLLNNLCNN